MRNWDIPKPSRMAIHFVAFFSMLCYEKIPSEHTVYIFIFLVRALLITLQILKHNMMFSAVLWWYNDEGWYVTSLHPSNDSWGGLPEYPQRDCSCNSEQFLGVSMSWLTRRNGCTELTEGDWLVNGWLKNERSSIFPEICWRDAQPSDIWNSIGLY